MWVVFAFGSALFAGITSVLAKCGIRKTDSTVATAIRTIVVLAFSWLMVFLTGSWSQVGDISGKTWIFLVLSGLATGASWLCYFKALQLGDISKVVPIDKSSVILTILLAFLFLGEEISPPKAVGVLGIGLGTFLMLPPGAKALQDGGERGGEERLRHRGWLFYAVGSAVFASLTSILGKVGISDVDSSLGTAILNFILGKVGVSDADSNLGTAVLNFFLGQAGTSAVDSNLATAIRTCVVLVMAWAMVFVTGKRHMVREIPKAELGFLCLSGVATGGSWLCYYKALQDGPASVVTPVDKLSILVTVLFSWFVFRERLSKRAFLGLALIVAGTLAMLVPWPIPSFFGISLEFL